MGYYKISDTTLNAIATAIRGKNSNAPDDMTGEEFAQYINEIQINDYGNDVISRSVTEIESDAESVGSYAFNSYYSLTSVSLPNCTSIGDSAFSYCTNLTSAFFPSCTSIGGSAFYSCSNLISISFPSCTSIRSSTFYNCTKLTSASLPNCTSIGNSAFYNCSNLISISFPSCTSIGGSAFYNCSNLISISFPSCTSIGNSAFSSCSKLTDVYLGTTVPTSNGSLSSYAKTIHVPASALEAYQASSVWNISNFTLVSYDPYAIIDGIQYDGMNSWEEWITSDKNTIGLKIKNGIILNSDSTKFLCNDNVAVKPGDSAYGNFTLESIE